MLTEEQVRDFYSRIADQVRKLKKKPLSSNAMDSYNFRSSLEKIKWISMTHKISSWCSVGVHIIEISKMVALEKSSVEIVAAKQKWMTWFCSFGVMTFLCYLLENSLHQLWKWILIQATSIHFYTILKTPCHTLHRKVVIFFCTQRTFSQAIF